MKWISIKKELPTEDTIVLVCNCKCPSLPPLLAVFDETDNFFASLYCHSSFPINVTHWTCYPSLPKEEV